MKKFAESLPAEPFFLKAEPGERFCLYHAPRPNMKCYGSFIYIHPFGEEMNKSRRVAALQARSFAAMGYGVLQIDLFGCGDSSGEFKEARWDIWKQDLAIASKWLEDQSAAPINLWGLRLGALLALDFAKNSENFVETINTIILWQPVLNGKSFLSQFLRLQLVNKLLTGDAKEKEGAKTSRDSLAAGSTLEVAGYELTPDLATAIDNLKITELMIIKGIIHWFDIGAEARQSVTPATAKILDAWKKEGDNLHIHLVSCLPFWATQEITECPELIAVTSRLFAKNYHDI